ncbi:Penicillin acylase family protein [Sulfidibacter corallicola]|uniref:Penicillin acylase family protein n=1 Tax=Sulfidibacter corallicola TaxID=2818388 RepID=A0A8A4TGS0_SULCO|nr:penicillin acylase family protein [Sulfidibacter corallicola]QTD48750.1 penicillin acylase family protein [Sulfidibacter corallicola]
MRLTGLLYLCILMSPLAAQVRIIPHLTSADGGFETTVILENQSADDREWRLTPYDAAGSALDPVTGTLAGRATTSMSAAELLGATASHATITGEDLTVSVAYVIATGDGSPAHVTETSDHATRHRFFSGDWSTVFDGFAVVNTGAEAADVWVAQKASDGTITQSLRIATELAPMAKALYVLGSPDGSEFDADAGFVYEVYATVPLAVTALRGNLPGATYLWANQTRGIGTAESTRDGQGVWFIENGSLYDVIEMMGYNVASDRLWQMETFRRLGLGRLSELPLISNEETLAQDKFTRMVGYSEAEYWQAFEDLEPEAKTMVRAYTEGVNRRRAEAMADPNLMPIEFKALGLAVEPWREIDVLSIIIAMLRSFDQQDYGSGQMENAALLQQLQTQFPDQAGDMFADLRWFNDPDAPTMIPADSPAKMTTPLSTAPAGRLRSDVDFVALHHYLEDRHVSREQVQKSLNAKIKMGSYAWVVAGDRTESGNPILYSGPQMGFMTPSIVIEGSINGGGLQISGGTVPGIPGILIGRTPHHSWSMQVGHANSMDLYMEETPTENELHRTETFIGPNGEEETLNIYRTEHGPLISLEPAVAWKYAHWDFEFRTIQAFFDMATAQNMDAFGAALERVGVSQHFCYADREGNIAYWMSGRNPVRPEGDYRLPQGALAGVPVLEYDSAVTHPLVHDRNTAQGFYGGWNNKARQDVPNSNVDGGRYYGPYHRAIEVENHLRELVNRGDVQFEEVRGVALAIASTEQHVAPSLAVPFNAETPLGPGGDGGNPWPLIRDAFTAAVAAEPSDARNDAIDLLNAWDGYFVEGGPSSWALGADRADAWMLLDSWIRGVLNLTFEEVNNIDNPVYMNVLIHGLDTGTALQNSYDWFTNADPNAPQTRNAVIVQALDDALAALGEQPWGQGLRGTLQFDHPLLSLLTGAPLHQVPFSNRSTYAHCIEVGETGPVRIDSMFPLGESGNIYGEGLTFELDTHFLSMTPFFDDFSHRSFPLFTPAKQQ